MENPKTLYKITTEEKWTKVLANLYEGNNNNTKRKKKKEEDSGLFSSPILMGFIMGYTMCIFMMSDQSLSSYWLKSFCITLSTSCTIS